MNLTPENPTRRLKPLQLAAIGTLVIILSAAAIWLATPLQAETTSLNKAEKTQNVIVSRGANAKRAYVLPKSVPYDTGIIIFPASHVNAEAYIASFVPTVQQSQAAIFVLKSPLNLPALDTGAPNQIMAENPRIKHWYVGGHGAGGTAACQYARSEAAKLTGVILMNASCWNNLSKTKLLMLKLTSQYGRPPDLTSVVGGANWAPKQTKRAEVAGAVHASFGSYGQPFGGGVPPRSAEQINDQVAQEIQSLLSQGRN